jgi:sterol desaturase/sphingolipid hydroxylase (fatty acid hydroxylase superfamily)
MLTSWGPWSDKAYFLDKMSLGELTRAFFTHYSIQAYIVLAAVATGISLYVMTSFWQPLVAALVTVAVYPLAEYLIHRFLLHSTFLFKHKATAKVWKRIHYDHHQNPHDLSVLFGALYTTLPTIALIAFPIGFLVAGPAGGFAAFAAACIVFCGYEFVHCVQHLPFTPRLAWLRDLKKRHLSHHFHSEHGNFGITSNIWDHVFGTFYAQPKDQPKSATVHNLGYTGEAKRQWPWVAELSADDDTYAIRRRRRAA